MFLSSANYSAAVSKLIAESKSLSIAVAYWGRTAENLLLPTNGKEVRVICNLASGGTNPEPIRKLLGHKEVTIRQVDNLHGKVVVGDSVAIVGSANFSTNGLWLDGEESAGLSEAGILTVDPEQIANAQAWFEGLWIAARNITTEDLDIAERCRRSLGGLRPPKADSLMNAPILDLKDRPIYLAIWRLQASCKAFDAFHDVVEGAGTKEGEIARAHSQNLSFFEEWESLPIDAWLISVYFGKGGKVDVQGVWKRVPELDATFQDGEGPAKSIQILVKQKSVCGMSFRRKDKDELREILKPRIAELWSRTREDYCVAVPLCEALEGK